MDQAATHRLSGYGVADAVVRIEGRDGGIMGAGVAISPRHIATCTHVLLDALDLDHGCLPPLGAVIEVTVWHSGAPQHPKVRLLP